MCEITREKPEDGKPKSRAWDTIFIHLKLKSVVGFFLKEKHALQDYLCRISLFKFNEMYTLR